jgi:HTH-type transcriptional regulator/antitoxin HipB
MAIRSIREIAAVVRGRRLDLGLSQSQLATQAGVSRKWISEFESSKSTAELGLVLRVLDALDLSLELVAQADPAGQSHGGVDLDALLKQLRSPQATETPDE